MSYNQNESNVEVGARRARSKRNENIEMLICAEMAAAAWLIEMLMRRKYWYSQR
jgi:hypothetical protein